MTTRYVEKYEVDHKQSWSVDCPYCLVETELVYHEMASGHAECCNCEKEFEIKS